MAGSLGIRNPFRYRGYVYDEESGLYYLRSRYYNPRMERFLSADIVQNTYSSVLHNNLYCYCLNNPVIFQDSEGRFPILAIGIGALLMMAAEAAVTAAVYTACVVLTAVVAVEVTKVITDAVQTHANERVQQEVAVETQVQTQTQSNNQSKRNDNKIHYHHIFAQTAW